jgi:HEPN superfamily protein
MNTGLTVPSSAVASNTLPSRTVPSRTASSRQAPVSRTPCRVAPSALALLESARHGLADAGGTPDPGGRYVAAHLAALRAAAAVVTAKADPGKGRRRSGPRSVWELLPRVEPTLAEWAAFFAAGAGKRAAAEAGLSRAVSASEADDLLRDAETFLSLAESVLGVPTAPLLPLRSAG